MVHLTTALCRAYHSGHLTIRLALGGCTNRPFYRIVAAHNKRPRDGPFVEQLGSYDPLPNSHGEKLVALNLERIRYWIGCGAHLSKPMEKLLGSSTPSFYRARGRFKLVFSKMMRVENDFYYFQADKLF